MPSLAPSLLVAVPQMQDPDFSRTVTLLLASNAEGSFGLILNRSSQIPLSEVCEQTNLLCSRDFTVRMGGPVERERAWVLYGPTMHDETSFKVGDNLYVTGSRQTLGHLAVSEERFQVFLGYAGWGPGQLEYELNEGSWLLSTQVEPDLFFEYEGEAMWREVIRAMGLDPGRIGVGGGGLH